MIRKEVKKTWQKKLQCIEMLEQASMSQKHMRINIPKQLLRKESKNPNNLPGLPKAGNPYFKFKNINMKINLLYIPILKAKEGEFKGLEALKKENLLKISPLFEITNIPWNYADEVEGKSIDNHLEKVGKKIFDAIEYTPFFVDSRHIDGDRNMENGEHHLQYLFQDFRDKKLRAIPVTTLSKMDAYQNAVKEIQILDKKGICLRIDLSDLAKKDFEFNLTSFLRFINVELNNIDLLIDLKNIEADDQDLLLITIASIINSKIPNLDEWRNLILSGTSFPENLSQISANSIDTIERVEWNLYNELVRSGLKRIPIFSDYTVSNSEVTEMDPRLITMSASLRYTYDNYWLIVRGRSVKTQGWIQYHNLCANLLKRPEYMGNDFSWGDHYIEECANQKVGTGNATTWRKVGNNHHIEYVLTQLPT